MRQADELNMCCWRGGWPLTSGWGAGQAGVKENYRDRHGYVLGTAVCVRVCVWRSQAWLNVNRGETRGRDIGTFQASGFVRTGMYREKNDEGKKDGEDEEKMCWIFSLLFFNSLNFDHLDIKSHKQKRVCASWIPAVPLGVCDVWCGWQVSITRKLMS